MARNKRREEAHTQNDSTGGTADLTPRRILKLTHQWTAPGRDGVWFIYDCFVCCCDLKQFFNYFHYGS